MIHAQNKDMITSQYYNRNGIKGMKKHTQNKLTLHKFSVHVHFTDRVDTGNDIRRRWHRAAPQPVRLDVQLTQGRLS